MVSVLVSPTSHPWFTPQRLTSVAVAGGAEGGEGRETRAQQADIRSDMSLAEVLDWGSQPKVGLIHGPGHKVIAIQTTLAQAFRHCIDTHEGVFVHQHS